MSENRMLSDEILLGLIKKNGGGGGGGTSYTAGNYIDINNDVISVRKSITDKEFVENVGYTGDIRKVTVPYTGRYKLKVWGASGGNPSDGYSKGGYGGYSEGIIQLNAGDELYVCVGGAGTGGGSGTAGYNGGGLANYGGWQRGSGGGATHIARVSGLLNSLAENINDILIVAGGGGGAGYYNANEYGTGGSGGGYHGGDGIVRKSGTKGTGGTQTAGGTGNGTGTFGQGASPSSHGSGGGGGLYGGGASQNTSGAGGGSGYLSPELEKGCMYGYSVPETADEECRTISVDEYNTNHIDKVAKVGDGYAVISLANDSSLDLVTKEDIAPVNYSTTEQKTGQKWIDGKDIYFKTLSTPISITANDQWIDTGLSDIDNLIDYTIRLTRDDEPVGSAFNSGYIDVVVRNNTLSVKGHNLTVTDLYSISSMTIYYTKTT